MLKNSFLNFKNSFLNFKNSFLWLKSPFYSWNFLFNYSSGFSCVRPFKLLLRYLNVHASFYSKLSFNQPLGFSCLRPFNLHTSLVHICTCSYVPAAQILFTYISRFLLHTFILKSVIVIRILLDNFMTENHFSCQFILKKLLLFISANFYI